MNFAKFLRTPFLQNNSGRLFPMVRDIVVIKERFSCEGMITKFGKIFRSFCSQPNVSNLQGCLGIILSVIV